MSVSNYPTSYDTWTTLVNDQSVIVADTPNFLAACILQIEGFLGLNTYGATTVSYLLSHLPGQLANLSMGTNSISAYTYTSTVATGTSPFTVSSTTMVSNLNANLLNGKSAPSGTIVGTTDSQSISNKTITSSTVSGLSSPIAISDGGTGGVNRSAAFANLAPSTIGNSGMTLVTNGASIYWGYPTYSS